MGLQQLLCSPTHTSGNILDLMFTDITETVKIANIRNGTFLSDHCTVDFDVLPWKEVPTTQYTTYRKIKLIDTEAMMEELSEMGNNPNNSDLSLCILSFDNKLKTILNKHAPLTMQKSTTRAKNPWFTEEVHHHKKVLWRREKIYRKYWTIETWKAYETAYKSYKAKSQQAKLQTLSTSINDCGSETKKLYKPVNSILGTSKDNPMTDGDDKEKLASEFADYFLGKIQKIRNHFDHSDKYSPPNKDVCRMSSFKPVSKEEMSK